MKVVACSVLDTNLFFACIQVACVAGEQGESILEAPEATEKINTKDSLRSAIAIDPGFSFWEGHEETACLGTTKGNPEIEQAEAPVREVEEVFNRRDCGVSVSICLNYISFLIRSYPTMFYEQFGALGYGSRDS